MGPEEVAKVAAGAGFSPAVQMILVLVALTVALGAPAAMFVQSWRKRKRVDDAEGRSGEIATGLYQHLSEQVVMLTQRLDKISDAHNRLVGENAALKSRVASLEQCEETVHRLQAKLDTKDEIIAQRDRQVQALFKDLRDRDQKIIDLQDRLSALELRLAGDEARFCRNCDRER